MFSLAHVFTHGADSGGFRSGITDAEVIWIAGQPYLATAARPDAGIAVYDITGSGALLPSDTQVFSASMQGLSVASVIPVMLGGQHMILTAGPGHAGVTAYAVSATGQIGAGVVLAATASAPVALAQSGTYVFAALADGGVARFHIGASGELQALSTLSPFPAGADPRMTGLVAALAGGNDFLIGVSATGDRIDSYRVSANGALVLESSIGAADGLGINTPVDLRQVMLDGRTFVLVGSSVSSSVSVLELAADGTLSPTDHVIDSLNTRFGGLATLAVIEREGHVYVAAGGADDGLTLMELLPNGRLVHHLSIADSASVPLDNLSAISGFDHGGGISLYVASASEPGLAEFSVNLASAGAVRVGTLGNDVIQGGSSRDILVASEGADTLTGGGGQDLFLFHQDGISDTISDYQRGLDVIDLSALPFLYGPGQLSLVETATGGILYFSDFQLSVFSHDGAPLKLGDFRFETALYHALAAKAESGAGLGGLTILGTEGADMLSGGANADLLRGLTGDDTLDGGAGGDQLDGGDGVDLVTYSGAEGRVLVDLLSDASTAGFAVFYQRGAPEGDSYTDVENVTGGRNSDQLRGDHGDNVLEGERGWDRIYGRRGDDTLSGGEGGDVLYGNAGADVMSGGGTGPRDRFVYFSASDSQPGAGNRDVIMEFRPGIDRIELSRIDADITQGFRQDFSFVGSLPFSGLAGELRYATSHAQAITLVQADRDGDGSADFEIALTGTISLSVGDFLL